MPVVEPLEPVSQPGEPDNQPEEGDLSAGSLNEATRRHNLDISLLARHIGKMGQTFSCIVFDSFFWHFCSNKKIFFLTCCIITGTRTVRFLTFSVLHNDPAAHQDHCGEMPDSNPGHLPQKSSAQPISHHICLVSLPCSLRCTNIKRETNKLTMVRYLCNTYSEN